MPRTKLREKRIQPVGVSVDYNAMEKHCLLTMLGIAKTAQQHSKYGLRYASILVLIRHNLDKL